MENRVNVWFVRSSRQIAVIKATVILFNQHDIRNLLTQCFSPQIEPAEERAILEVDMCKSKRGNQLSTITQRRERRHFPSCYAHWKALFPLGFILQYRHISRNIFTRWILLDVAWFNKWRERSECIN